MNSINSDNVIRESKLNYNILVSLFDKLYNLNCKHKKFKLTNAQNTAILLGCSITRLIYPPKTYYAREIEKISGEIYAKRSKS